MLSKYSPQNWFEECLLFIIIIFIFIYCKQPFRICLVAFNPVLFHTLQSNSNMFFVLTLVRNF